jgi:hypothetical protein
LVEAHKLISLNENNNVLDKSQVQKMKSDLEDILKATVHDSDLKSLLTMSTTTACIKNMERLAIKSLEDRFDYVDKLLTCPGMSEELVEDDVVARTSVTNSKQRVTLIKKNLKEVRNSVIASMVEEEN